MRRKTLHPLPKPNNLSVFDRFEGDFMDNIRVLVNQEQIQKYIEAVASKISGKYAGNDNLMMIVLLEGARRFSDDMLKYIAFAPQVEYITASSYLGGTETTGKVKIISDIDDKIAGRDVLLVDDIYDTGLTLKAVTEYIEKHNPKSLATCVLMEKAKKHRQAIPVDFCGFKIEDSFLIGYGLDFDGKYRDLEFIASMQV